MVFTGRVEGTEEALDVLAALEAMASGLPVVANAVGGCREVVQDGVTGFLVPPSDAQGRRAVLSFLLDAQEGASRRSLMGAAGRFRAASAFSLDRETAAVRSL